MTSNGSTESKVSGNQAHPLVPWPLNNLNKKNIKVKQTKTPFTMPLDLNENRITQEE
jgi:hypothetical protein